jgi:hypothetical protein
MTPEEIAAALRPIGEGLEQDGYQLAVAVDDAGVALRIVAGPEACAECLVPKDLMGALAAQALGDAGLAPGRLEIAYPGEP